MIKDLSTSAAALYDGGWRANERDDLKLAYDLTDDAADAICKELKAIATAGGRYTVIGTPLHGSQEYGSSDDLREIIKLWARHKVDGCTCLCTQVYDNEEERWITDWEMVDRYEAAGITLAEFSRLINEGRREARQ